MFRNVLCLRQIALELYIINISYSYPWSGVGGIYFILLYLSSTEEALTLRLDQPGLEQMPLRSSTEPLSHQQNFVLTLTVLVMTLMHCDTFEQDNYSTVGGDGEVGSSRYESALLPHARA